MPIDTVQISDASEYLEVTLTDGRQGRVPATVLVNPTTGLPYAATGGGGGGGGDASAANQTTQITAANLTNTRVGDLTEAAPGTDTASSGVNGRLQRIAQRLTSLIGLLPASLGAKAPSASLSIVQAVTTPTNIGGSLTTGGSAQNAAAANAARTGWWIQNLHPSSDLWVSTLATAVQSQPSIRIRPGELYEAPPWAVGTGAISVIGPTTGQTWSGREA